MHVNKPARLLTEERRRQLAKQVHEIAEEHKIAVRSVRHDSNDMLKTMLKEREAGLRFRDEEIAKLKEASRGRMGTRGTSVPRSPRMGSPRVPSRQTSPAAGDLRGRSGLLHPLRNAES